MAQKLKITIPVPALDSDMGTAHLQLVTDKGYSGGIHSSASVHYLNADGCMVFEVFGDFSKVIARRPGSATQKALNTLHADTFTPEMIESVKVTVAAFYAEKNKGAR